MPKNKFLFLSAFLVLGSAVCTHAWSLWSDITRYDGARTLRNRAYKALEIHGAATLDHVTVEKTLMVTGSTELEDSSIGGTTTIMGALETKGKCILGGRADVKGGLVAEGLEVKGKLMVGGSLEVTDSRFADIVAKSNNNQTYSFIKSQANVLMVNGLGAKRVTLKDAHIKTIEFEHEEGVVILKGAASVDEVINGKIEKK